ncbi:MAG TPA: hypothetical protein PKE06_19480 [Flavilitoribacter sp.]|nr:hypothetical protein [Flavilitoribacter sp.]
MIVYGTSARKADSFEIQNTVCPSCGQSASQHVTVFSRYAHVYWIPLFPTGKKSVAECANCKRTIEQKQFPDQLKMRFDQRVTKVKTPIVHWLGTGIIGLAVVAFSAGSLIESSGTPDPRETLLHADIAAMTSSPSALADSNAFLIKALFDDFISDEMDKEHFEYRSNVQDGKILVLVKIPDLKRVKKEERGDLMDVIDTLLDLQEGVKDHERYIGIHGKYNMMLVRTPSFEDEGTIVSEEPLYGFYGEKAQTN